MQRALPRMTSIPWARGLAGLLFVVTVAAILVDVALWAGQRFQAPPVSFVSGQWILVLEMFMAVSYAAMGWLLATRLVRNALGWIFLAIGLAMALQLTATFMVQQGHQAFRALQPMELWGAWLSSTVHLPLTITLYAIVFLIFPDGRPLSTRWSWAGWVTVAGAALVITAAGLSPVGLVWFPSLPNPLAAPTSVGPALVALGLTGLVLLVAGTLAATAAMFVRYRRAGDVQRAQLRWIAVAVLLLAGGGLPFVISRYALRMDYSSGEVLLVIAVAAGCFLPVAAAIAVLRHRLYDIDLIINRALVYIPLTAILGGMYTAGVALSQRVFVAFTGDRSDAAIVISTLVVASMFTQVKNWLQGVVDRRFKPATGFFSSGPTTAPATVGVAAATAVDSGSLEELSARVAQLELQLSRSGTVKGRSTAAAEANPLHSEHAGH